MGNNNATASLTEEESSKQETNGKSFPLKTVSLDTTQDQEFLAWEEKAGDEEKESFPDGGKIDKGIAGAEPQSKESIEDPKVKNAEEAEEEMHQSGSESSVMETDEQLQKQTSGVEILTEVEEQCLSITETQSIVNEVITIESGNEDKPCVIDETVFVSPSLYETVESEEEKMIDEPQEEIVHAADVAKLDQETGLEQTTGFAELEPQEILNLDDRVDDDEVTNEEKVDHVISKLGSQESSVIQESGLEVYKEERVMEIGRETSLKRMSRCRSLPLSQNSRVMRDSMVPEVVFPPRNKIGLEEANKSETLLVACIGSNKAHESSDEVNECDEEGSDELTAKTPLLCQDKSEIYEATIDVEEKTVMLKMSESEEKKGVEMSLGFSKEHNERYEANDSFKDDNLVDRKASWGFTKGRVRKRSKSSILGTCLCCATAMH